MLSDLLTQCVEMTHQLVKTKQKANINIRVGSDFHYQLCSQAEEAFATGRKVSPSQRKRNNIRRSEFEKKRLDEKMYDEEVKVEAKEDSETKVGTRDIDVQTDPEANVERKILVLRRTLSPWKVLE